MALTGTNQTMTGDSNREFMADAQISVNTTISTIGVSLVVFVFLVLVRGLITEIPILGPLVELVYYVTLLVLVASLAYFLYFSVFE